MKLFRIVQTGYGVQSVRFFGDNSGAQAFGLEEGNYLQTIDMIEQMGGRPLRVGKGAAPGGARSPEVEALLRDWD